uniref:hypothetical protein n=1 Tax=Eshraghiella crossota TaxID=45851 RepID=UPI004029C4BC
VFVHSGAARRDGLEKGRALGAGWIPEAVQKQMLDLTKTRSPVQEKERTIGAGQSTLRKLNSTKG